MSDVASLLFYLLVFSLSSLLFYVGRKKAKKVFTALALALPILVGGFRYNVGTDYASYERMYLSFLDTGLTDYFSENVFNIEPAFFLLIKFGQLLTSSPYIIFLLSSLLTVTFFYLGIRNTLVKNKAILYFFFLTIIYPITFNATRQGIATSIGFLALTYLAKDRVAPYLALSVLAACFHTSGLVLFLAYPMLRLIRRKGDEARPNRFLIKASLIVGAITIAIPLLVHFVVQLDVLERYAGYTEYLSGVSISTILFKLSTIVAVSYFFSRFSNKNKIVYAYMIFALLEMITLGLWFSSAAIFRVTLYFAPFSLIMLIYILDIVSDKRSKRLLLFGYIIFALVYFIVAYFIAGQAEIVPYRFVTV